MTDQAVIDTAEAEEIVAPGADEVADLFLSIISDGLDHPELWRQLPAFLEQLPDLPQALSSRLMAESNEEARLLPALLLIQCFAARGQVDFAIQQIEPLAVRHSQSALVQGTLFHLNGLKDPENPKYRLEGRICPAPFTKFDVLERSTHLCCASWLHASAGDLSQEGWQEVWNSPTAQNIRASVHDGSYRYCNKMACPVIQAQDLQPAAELAAESEFWRDILENGLTEMEAGPQRVNLAYDRTCNLSCPSCRVEKYAADEATRQAYDDMQRSKVLPLLKNAKLVFVTGSGDPFASKNFRRLLTQLTAEEYPDLKFQIMTNGMLFTPRQLESFPSLHGRTETLKISIDAATGPTHELLRRGAQWPVMLENMAFAGELVAQGLIDYYELVFTVQAENFREMGDAVDLAKAVGAKGIYFGRITNWGTFSDAEYARKAVFLPSHPDHAEFLVCVRDQRLRDPMVFLGDMHEFAGAPSEERRAFAA
jgi:sulfatase maturation enzyme AslB (radical SAM superfamily)